MKRREDEHSELLKATRSELTNLDLILCVTNSRPSRLHILRILV